ncbi:SDR family oxidoreductase [Telmatocola sphagniphila]|uniref:SDR family oxidoreductase n=1 Tax=Telmatocola sphagniphila TaxID=1123043 RepID=A0A8E6B715_9BACT|nr:SDR family oxidoreductase [Telmatocola sphagniphila]QVL32911.1 SDR family oxidoreductase [Telmatocola sphagniphila]
MQNLKNRVAVVTGGGSGVGLATAKRFLEEGAQVVIAGRDAAKLAKAVESLQGGAKLHSFAADVTDTKQAQALIAEATRKFGKVDILVNNAGLNIKQRAFRELTPESWNQLVRTNLDGAFYCMSAVLPQMLARKDGLIININSVSGKRGNPLGGAGYCAGKFGLDGLSSCLANEERENGLRVTSIFPGEIDTPILDERPNPVSAEHRAKILKPEDIANVVVFVALQPPHVHIPELIVKPNWQGYM